MPHGQLLVEGKVAGTCESTGMKAVCYGDASCSYTQQANSRWLAGQSDFQSPYQRCVTTEHNLGCGTDGSKNTLAKVNNRASPTKFHASAIPLMSFPQGNLWRQWSQEMSWSLGDIQLYARSSFGRVWNRESIYVYRWQELSGFSREHLLCHLCNWNWWAPVTFWMHSCEVCKCYIKTPTNIITDFILSWS